MESEDSGEDIDRVVKRLDEELRKCDDSLRLRGIVKRVRPEVGVEMLMSVVEEVEGWDWMIQ